MTQTSENTTALKVTTLAFYLPQFHQIPENDDWWGTGFTEWRHLEQAKAWRPGHVIRRPIPPLGQYRLDDPAVMEQQWRLASENGVDAFAVWDYWMGGGKQLLERPIEMVLEKKLDFRYCLAWANHSWYDKSRNRLLCEQKFLGSEDYDLYFARLRRHFESDNYLKIDGKPVLFVFEGHALPDWGALFDQWERRAKECGFPGMYFIADRLHDGDPMIDRLDKYADGGRFLTRRNRMVVNYVKENLKKRFSVDLGPRWFDFRRFENDIVGKHSTEKFAPTLFTGWDTTPRHGRGGAIYENLDAASFERQLAVAEKHFARFPTSHHVLLLKSWNEWAEGNILEPDDIYGDAFLKALAAFRRRLARSTVSSLSPTAATAVSR